MSESEQDRCGDNAAVHRAKEDGKLVREQTKASLWLSILEKTGKGTGDLKENGFTGEKKCQAKAWQRKRKDL